MSEEEVAQPKVTLALRDGRKEVARMEKVGEGRWRATLPESVEDVSEIASMTVDRGSNEEVEFAFDSSPD